ncbi:ABC transporter ATP-binding protein [Nocardia neocaledoniensis NBRC 108232]|uniref:Peptide/nickel transport system ATP-binding protein n=1 Tax=Nocardia neocaledoniensis TaxID=236511 RepID=A0A317NW94_9NOCA|nr:ABC transporter ATP-binding protein [Nocardia neocaledoniensis]PWV79610.1 peptide/nickel transport system ATP-binding protein [Nocardia neocaledoniensis]GEM29473.1 ABC transporter ATP-binding protein [Nocardia neocaledoniensis NBRC 108232]
MSLLAIENLRIGFPSKDGAREVVHGVDLRIEPGEAVALVGESGSGKSVTARTLVGLAGAGARVSADTFDLFGQDARAHRERQWRRIRGSAIGFVLQDALVSLDPLGSVGAQLAEVQRAVTGRASTARSVELLTAVGVPEPERRLRQYPHELSGGLRQRVLIATAIAGDPDLIIADEPTTALDVTVQQQILELLRARKAAGTALLLISHDLAVVAEVADRVLVMRAGEVVEQGRTLDVLTQPTHPYTKKLLAAVPSAASRGSRLSVAGEPPSAERRPLPPRSVDASHVVLSVRDLRKTYGSGQAARTVVDGVDFDLFAGETLGIVGESGSGKTTTARLALRLVAPTSGRVLVDGKPWSELSERELRPLRGAAQLIAQDPLSSFDPRYTVERVIGESLDTVDVRGTARARRVRESLDAVGLAREVLDRHPRTLSGGQRQRVAIARALAPSPALLVADEPVSALDVSVQAQILDLLADLRADFGTALLLISHDLGVVQHLADRVLVMKDGRVVESGDVESVLRAPQHDYTRRLVASVPRLPEPVDGA